MKPFTKITILLFLAIAVLHLLRLIFGWEVIVNGKIIPMGVSLIGLLVPSFLSVMLYRESNGRW